MDNERVETNPHVMMGKPVIKGTRITVELILRKLSEGATEHDLLEAYPHLTREDIRAAMRYAADLLTNGTPAGSSVAPIASRRHELERLIAARFPPEGKAERIAAKRRLLDTLRFGIPIDIETAKWAAESPELEDF